MLNLDVNHRGIKLGRTHACLLFIVCLFVSVFFAGCENLNLPKLSAPTSINVENGVIQFARAENDEYYVFDINSNVFNVFPNANPYVHLYSQNSVNYLEYNASKLFGIGESATIKIKTCASGFTDSDWTSPLSYTHTEKMTTPTNLAISGNVLTWDAVRNAGVYNVKVITPNDNISADDPESVRLNEDLPKYQFNTNRFDFSSLLSTAGRYKFYVSSVSVDSSYSESDFTNKCVFDYTIQLDSPQGVNVHRVKNGESYEFHLTTVVDDRANALKIVVDNTEEIVELTDASINRDALSPNLIDVNLNQAFASKSIDFSAVRSYAFRVQCMYMSADTAFYTNSKLSNTVTSESAVKLDMPILSIEYDENSEKNIGTWSNLNPENIAYYSVWIFTPSGVKSLRVDNNINSVILDEDIIALAVQAVGRLGYLDSQVSEVKSNNTQALSTNFTAQCAGSTLVWTSVAGATYLVEAGEQAIVTDDNLISLLSLNDKVNSVRITTIVDGYVPLVREVNLSYSIRLATPGVAGNGFNSTNPYLLSFSSVEGAIGYRIYLSTDQEHKTAIPKVFTTTSVDISKYLITSASQEYSAYIQAVADPLGIYSDSELTQALAVEHSLVLAKPELMKTNNQVVFKSQESGEDKYTIRFNGVVGANSYEILVNFNRITILNDGRTNYYEADITRYLTSANSYSIMIRALPLESEEYIQASGYNTYTYELRQQLPEVTDIRVAEANGRYTLSFALQDNASSYRVRIVKLNDSTYIDYLLQHGLSNVFPVQGATDITDYVERGGEYRIYVTAVARQNSYYADSNESRMYGEVNKLTSLSAPSNVDFSNVAKDSFLIRWTSDEHADYYVVRVVNPNNKAKEYTVLNTNIQNIADFVDIEGDYLISVKSMVESNSANSQNYTSSAFSEAKVITHVYTNKFDFERAEVYYNGANYDLSIENIEDLTNVLWYHYLFGLNKNYGLELYLNVNGAGSTREAIITLKNEAQAKHLYNFSNDETWLQLLSNSTDAQLLAHLCNRILEVYPELAVLESNSGIGSVQASSSNISDGVKFTLKYWNALDYNADGEYISKINTESDFINISKDYANDFKYIDSELRKNVYSPFAIDSCEEMEVETSEQLLMAVQYGKRPVFKKSNTDAEKIFNNAKLLLSAIVGRNYTDIEKVDAIFSWLEYAYNVNYDATKIIQENEKTEGTVADYGTRKEFYLEGILLDITNADRGGSDGEFYLGDKNATSESLSKAFSLLCNIEGIKTRKVNGTVSYSTVSESHSWNRVYMNLPTASGTDSYAWYNVDIAYSDNRFIYNTINNNANSYNMASHLYFLVSDNYLFNNVDFGDITSISVGFEEKSNVVLTSSEEMTQCNYSYDYYSHSIFGMTYEEITSTLNALNIGSGITGFRYLKEYTYTAGVEYYQKYASTSGYSELQSFVLNNGILAKHYLLTNTNEGATVEFRISGNYLTGGDLTGNNSIATIINQGLTRYWQMGENNGFNPIVKRVYDRANNETTFVLALEWR